MDTNATFYTFPVTSGSTYYIKWDQTRSYPNGTSYGSGSYTGAVSVSAYYDDTAVFTNARDGYSTPKVFTAPNSGTFIVKVEKYSASYPTGSYAVRYSTTP
jgi:hypothetical protein